MGTTAEERDRAPRLSIGVPVYNAEAYLTEALSCLLAQTFGDFELVVSDNASIDRTRAICLAFADRDPRVRYERQAENLGANWNFNRVFELSRGELFKCWGVRSMGVIRSAELRRTGLYRPVFGWEKVFMAELALRGRFGLLPERMFYQRVHGAAISQRVVLQKDRGTLEAHYRERTLPFVRYVCGYVGGAWRSAPGFASFLCCLAWVAAYVCQVRKLGRLLRAKLPARKAAADAAATPAMAEVAST